MIKMISCILRYATHKTVFCPIKPITVILLRLKIKFSFTVTFPANRGNWVNTENFILLLKLPKFFFVPLFWITHSLQYIVQRQSKETSGPWLVTEVGAETIFPSVLPVVGSNIGRARWIQPINTWLHGWCCVMICMASGLLLLNGILLCQRGKKVFAHELMGLIGRALN